MGLRGPAIATTALVAAVVFAALWATGPPPAPIRPGQPAPEFALPRLGDGAPVELSDLRGRVVLLNFWATWCKPCEDEMPAMERLYAELAGPGFEMLAVSVDAGRSEVEAFQERLGVTFPILLDPAKRVSASYQSYRFPESFLIDSEGRILARYIGPRDWDANVYRDRIRRLISGEATGAEGAPP
ncbi:MAG: TlpA family protein disulfide reductase [Myxococcota bacterium]|nr:TlpA family protein disulfide reductase [Myxococcota bacterium]